MVERLAYWICLLQMPVYISQKDVDGGLGWDHTTKGVIFFAWALVQNLTPVVAGAMADKYGRKKAFYASAFIIISSYFLIATQRNFLGFLCGVILLGLGSGVYKPALLGSLALRMNKRNSSFGWGLNVALINAALFACPPIAVALEKVSVNLVFYASAAISALNIFIFLSLDKDNAENFVPSFAFKKIFSGLFQKQVIGFILPMCGFTIIYMQFYETLPNFVFDWSDTSALAYRLPAFMSQETPRGLMISYKWLYNINSSLIVVFVALIAFAIRKRGPISSIIAGMTLLAAGLFLAGASMQGSLLITGIIIYTFGEMIVNPKFNHYIAGIAPKNEISMYMSYTGISWAAGLGAGSLLGGWLYDNYGEKASLAAKYLKDIYHIDVPAANASVKLSEMTGLSQQAIAKLLWIQYDPWLIWLPFITIGILSIIALAFYYKMMSEKNQKWVYS